MQTIPVSAIEAASPQQHLNQLLHRFKTLNVKISFEFPSIKFPLRSEYKQNQIKIQLRIQLSSYVHISYSHCVQSSLIYIQAFTAITTTLLLHILYSKYKQVRNTMPSRICLMTEVKSKNRSKNCTSRETANELQGFSHLAFLLTQWLEITSHYSSCSLISTIWSLKPTLYCSLKKYLDQCLYELEFTLA